MKKCPMSRNRKNEFGAETTRAVWAACKGRCSYCGVHLNRPDPTKEKDNIYLSKLFTMDHVLAIAKGGDNSLSNLKGSCRRCNNAKGASSLNFLRLWLYREKNPAICKFNYQQYEWLLDHGIDLGKLIQYKFYFERHK